MPQRTLSVHTLFVTTLSPNQVRALPRRGLHCLACVCAVERIAEAVVFSDVDAGGNLMDRLGSAVADGAAAVAQATGTHVMVCAHAERDFRCQMCGPRLLRMLPSAVEAAGGALDEDTFVYGSSHVGGHRFAGNVLVYPSGDWYGHVQTQEHVDGIAALHVGRGNAEPSVANCLSSLPAHWRGRTGLGPAEARAAVGASAGEGEAPSESDTE